MDYQPNFTVSAAAISMVAEISALIERYIITQEAAESLKLRRANKIKTIQSLPLRRFMTELILISRLKFPAADRFSI